MDCRNVKFEKVNTKSSNQTHLKIDAHGNSTAPSTPNLREMRTAERGSWHAIQQRISLSNHNSQRLGDSPMKAIKTSSYGWDSLSANALMSDKDFSMNDSKRSRNRASVGRPTSDWNSNKLWVALMERKMASTRPWERFKF